MRLSLNTMLCLPKMKTEVNTSQHGIVYSSIKCADESTAFSSITYPQIKLSLDEKIALFRNFFKGRDDVFARRWFNKATEKGGYQPVCINEWRRGIMR